MRTLLAFILISSAVPVRPCRAAEANVSDKFAQVRGFKVDITNAGDKKGGSAWESVSGGNMIIELVQSSQGSNVVVTTGATALTVRMKTKTLLGTYSTSISIPSDQVKGEGQELLKAIKEAKIIGNSVGHARSCAGGPCLSSSVELLPADAAHSEGSIILGRDNEYWSATLSCYYNTVAGALQAGLTGAAPLRRANDTWSVDLKRPACIQAPAGDGTAAAETVVFRPHRGEVK